MNLTNQPNQLNQPTLPIMKTRKHEACIRILREYISTVEDATVQPQLLKDLENLRQLGGATFYKMLAMQFTSFKGRPETLEVLSKFAAESAKRDNDVKNNRLAVVVNTDSCVKCGKAHKGYTVKLDKHGIPYVICGLSDKRVDVYLQPSEKVNFNSLKELASLTRTVFTIDHSKSSEEETNKLLAYFEAQHA